MEVAEILSRIERITGKFEREAVEAAVARRDEVILGLLQTLEEIADPERAVQIDAEDDFMGHLYAVYLLAQFREIRAYPLLVRIAELPGDLLDSLFDDFIASDLGNVLASVCGGDISGIQSIIENETADVWVRGAGLQSLTILVGAGEKRREEVVDYFAFLFRGKLARTTDNEVVWSQLVFSSADICAEELLSDIEQAYEDDLVDTTFIGLDEVRRDLAMGKDQVLARLATDPHHHLIDDTVKEMEWWDCFKEKKPLPAQDAAEITEGIRAQWADSILPFKRSTPKIGRNDPCFCGSGKKYKKCCGT
ncbi:MAG TPA: DUF1186 domain-containing protein [Terracidiphilus sp.]|jgi:hypothetical protein|nr:DUF1186 domain-containing protein [Terracidiphilus sp.]